VGGLVALINANVDERLLDKLQQNINNKNIMAYPMDELICFKK